MLIGARLTVQWYIDFNLTVPNPLSYSIARALLDPGDQCSVLDDTVEHLPDRLRSCRHGRRSTVLRVRALTSAAHPACATDSLRVNVRLCVLKANVIYAVYSD